MSEHAVKIDEKTKMAELCHNCRGSDAALEPDVPDILVASTNGHEECLERLIKAGADVNVSGRNYETALIRAGANNHNTCLEMLIQAGADVNAKGYYGRTALIAAVEKGNDHCLQSLIKAGANVNAAYNNSKTALIQAAWRGHDNCIKLLLQAGADVKIAMYGGADDRDTALIVAARTGCWKCVNLLINAGADVNVPGKDGKTALMEAARSSSLKCLQLVLKAGARINTMTHTYLQKALEIHIVFTSSRPFCKAPNKDIAMLLLAAGETLDGTTVTKVGDFGITDVPIKVPQWILNLRDDISLKHLCRETIRKCLLNLNPHANLFARVPQLRGLPPSLVEYLLYGVKWTWTPMGNNVVT